MHRSRLSIFLFALFGAWLAGTTMVLAAAEQEPQERQELKVVASLKPIHSLVAGVMTGVGVPVLLNDGSVSPHSASLRPSQAKRLAEADVVFWLGRDLEGYLAKPLQSLAGRARVIDLSADERIRTLPRRQARNWLLDHNDGGGKAGSAVPPDPHLWLDPRNAQAMVEVIAAELSAADPAHGKIYKANGAHLIGRLAALDQELSRTLDGVQGLPYIVAHDAYQYFEKRYGLNAVGVIAIDPEQPPGAKHLLKIRRQLREQDLRCVFAEPQLNPVLAKKITEGTKARVAILDPLGSDIQAGADLYGILLRRMAAEFVACLNPE